MPTVSQVKKVPSGSSESTGELTADASGWVVLGKPAPRPELLVLLTGVDVEIDLELGVLPVDTCDLLPSGHGKIGEEKCSSDGTGKAQSCCRSAVLVETGLKLLPIPGESWARDSVAAGLAASCFKYKGVEAAMGL